VLTAAIDTLISVPVWLLLTLVFLFPALEASVFLGLVVPGETMVVIGGVAAQAGRVSLVVVIVLAIAGALVGDQVGFYVGRRFGPRLIDRMPSDTRRGRHLGSAMSFVRRRGPIAVTFGRWTASLRSLVPGIAGMSGMRQRSFTSANVIGGVVWASVVAVAGYLAGESYRALESRLGLAANILLGVTFVLVIVLWLLAVVRHRRGSTAGTAAREAAADAPAPAPADAPAQAHPVPDVR
jgi:undecaprenyl-diphosphatase